MGSAAIEVSNRDTDTSVPATPASAASRHLDDQLRAAVASRLTKRWSPAKIGKSLRRRWPSGTAGTCATKRSARRVYRRLVVPTDLRTLRTGRAYRHKRGRGRTRDGTLKQSTDMKPIHAQPAVVKARTQLGHWEADLIVGAMQRSGQRMHPIEAVESPGVRGSEWLSR